jgi:hypothetical protein
MIPFQEPSNPQLIQMVGRSKIENLSSDLLRYPERGVLRGRLAVDQFLNPILGRALFPLITSLAGNAKNIGRFSKYS